MMVMVMVVVVAEKHLRREVAAAKSKRLVQSEQSGQRTHGERQDQDHE